MQRHKLDNGSKARSKDRAFFVLRAGVLWAGRAHCAMHRVGAVKMDMMDIMDIMDSWHMALCQPCAFEISQHMAHTAPCAPPPYTSVHLRTYPYCIAHSIGLAQCALPTNRTHSHVLSKFQSTWHTGCHRPSIVFPVFIVFPVGFAPAMRLAQCALPANRTHSPVLSKFQSAWHTHSQVP